MSAQTAFLRWFEELDSSDVAIVGGKNASLGEVISELKEEGVRVPGGFATTADAYRTFVEANDIEEDMRGLLEGWQKNERSLQETGEAIRRLFRHGSFSEEIALAIREAYRQLSERYASEGSDKDGAPEVDVAARSSATADSLDHHSS